MSQFDGNGTHQDQGSPGRGQVAAQTSLFRVTFLRSQLSRSFFLLNVLGNSISLPTDDGALGNQHKQAKLIRGGIKEKPRNPIY